jgi:2-dehydro-3-deoxyphosphogluconate aldolase/(4S)-4-hydroxy-2-oxoglutarate aldolase
MASFKFDQVKFNSVPVVGIIRGVNPADFEMILRPFINAGLTTLEITLNTSQAGSLICMANDFFRGEVNIGAGTVRSLHDLDLALEYGASFIVTPVLNRAVVRKCVELKIPVFPGAFTPTEISEAFDEGATMIKVFPASSVGPEYIKNVKAPMPEIRLMPTGGVTIENLMAYKNAGADAYGMGSPLFRTDFISQKNWKGLEGHFRAVADAIRII